VALGALILLVLVGTAIWRYVPPILGVRDARTTAADLSARVKDLGPGDVTTASIAELRALVARLDEQLAPAAALLRDDPLVGLLRSVGPVGTQVTAADSLVAAADGLVEAAGLGLDLGDRVAALRESGDSTQGLIPGMVGIIADSGSDVDRIATLLTDARTQLAAIPDSAVSQLREARDLVAEPLARYLPLLEGYRAVDDRLPGILGQDEMRRYLVLAQNPAELRPTGGFIGTYGLLTLDGGRIASMEFHDVYTLDDQQGMPYQQPPEELEAYLLGRSSWELADANWSPDFPTAAQEALRLYTLESGDADIDGVIAITTYALDRLLEVTGPVLVPGTDVTVGPGEVTLKGIANTRADAPLAAGSEDRKRFLSLLADEVLRQLFALDVSRWTDLAAAAQDIGVRRLALAWFPDPSEQAVVEGSRWAGRLRTDGTDHLMVVDANVTPSSKLSPIVPRSTDLTVTIDPSGSAEHRLRLEWHSEADRSGEPYETLRAASESAAGQYGLLTRVLVPLDSEIIEVVGDSVLPVSGVEFETEVAGVRSWGNYLLVEPGMTAWLEDTWVTPSVVEADGEGSRYHLVLQKQPGQIAEPVRIAIELPDGATVSSAPGGATVDGTTVRWEGTLTEDLELDIRFDP
jgi:hypothetical protein